MDTPQRDKPGLASFEEGATDPTLLERKSVLIGMAASMGLVFTNSARPSAAAAGTVKPSPIATTQPAYVPRWTPTTTYVLGQQVISPHNDVVSAKVSHTSSAIYASDTEKWALSATFARQDSAPVSLSKFGVLPTASAAANVAGFASAAASANTNLFLPAGTYNVQLTEGQSLMSFTGRCHLRIIGDNAVLKDTTTYTNNGPLTSMILLDNCEDIEIAGVEYVGPVLGSPTSLHGYQGATLVRAINGTDGVKIDMRASNARYGLQTGQYQDGTVGNCKNFDLRLRGTMIGYPVAAYCASGIRHDIDVDGVHRVAYLAGCDDVTGVARWRDQYIADTSYLITDALTSGTDAVAQAAPPANPTTSRGCTNIDVTSIDKGSTVFQPSSSCAGICLSRVDPRTTFRNIRVSAYSVGTDTMSTTVGAFRIMSGAKTLNSRYGFNWEPSILLENIEVSGVIDHSAATLAGNTGSEFYVSTYDTNVSHAATVRNLQVDGLTILPSSAMGGRSSYLLAPGLASPATFRNFNTPGVALVLITNGAAATALDSCNIAGLDLSGVTGGSRVVLAASTVGWITNTSGETANLHTLGTLVGGAGGLTCVREKTLTLAGASTSWTSAIPQGALVLGVQARVRASITGSTSWDIGDAALTSRFGTYLNVAPATTQGTRSYAASEISPRYYRANTDLVITSRGGNFTGGVVRVVVTYMIFPDPTS